MSGPPPHPRADNEVKEPVTVAVVDHRAPSDVGEWPARIEALAPAALAAAWRERTGDAVPLAALDALDVALLDDAAIGQVHAEFLAAPAPTDVITFDHGEILLGTETIARQAAAHAEPFGRELLRCFIHGLLHLAGHRDDTPDARAQMARAQEQIVEDLWPAGGAGPASRVV